MVSLRGSDAVEELGKNEDLKRRTGEEGECENARRRKENDATRRLTSRVSVLPRQVIRLPIRDRVDFETNGRSKVSLCSSISEKNKIELTSSWPNLIRRLNRWSSSKI